MNFISGEKFYDIADFIYSSDFVENNNEDYNKLVNNFDLSKLKNLNIVYLHTMYKNQFFKLIKNAPNKFVVITHNSDINIESIENLPDNVIKWYSQNVNCVDQRLESLPIGLENSRWFPHIMKNNKILLKINENKNIKNLLYINHNINTYKLDREEPYILFKNKSWVDLEYGRNGYEYDKYIDSIYNHKFILSPRGNGIDTHRKWECLYLKSIPIEKRNINNSFYTDLPICFVDSWEEITEDFLNNEYNRIINTKWNLEKLDMEYWKNKIRSEYNRNK